MRDDFQAACWIGGIRCLGFSGCIVNGVGNELPALRFIFRLPQTRFQAAFVNSVRSEAAHPMAVGISCVRRFQAACWDVCANCFQAAYAGCFGGEPLPFHFVIVLFWVSGCLKLVFRLLCKQRAQRSCTLYGKICFQAAHSLFKRYLLDSFRARRYHAWAACLLGGWLLA